MCHQIQYVHTNQVTMSEALEESVEVTSHQLLTTHSETEIMSRTPVEILEWQSTVTEVKIHNTDNSREGMNRHKKGQ